MSWILDSRYCFSDEAHHRGLKSWRDSLFGSQSGNRRNAVEIGDVGFERVSKLMYARGGGFQGRSLAVLKVKSAYN
jgi:hypothetical protein